MRPASRRFGPLSLLAIGIVASPLRAQPRDLEIGEIHYFGHSGLDLDRIRQALPIRSGESIPWSSWKDRSSEIRESVRSVAGAPATAVEAVCCDPQGRSTLYVGLPGASSRRMKWNEEPAGPERLTTEVMSLYGEMSSRWMAAVQRGEAAEDGSQGYSLMKAPEVREAQLKLREVALSDPVQIKGVLARSSNAEHRRAAATILGYATPDAAMVQALTLAVRDPDVHVRNDAVRALAVLAGAKPDLARTIDPDPFIEMLSSTDWTDRNKGVFLLTAIAPSRDASFTRALKERALAPLTEMAGWDDAHAGGARALLRRIESAR